MQPTVVSPGQPTSDQTPPPEPTTSEEPASNWRYSDGVSSPGMSSFEQEPDRTPDDAVAWTASEYVTHDKSPMWYLALVIVFMGFGGLAYVLTKDWFTLGVVVVVAVLFGISAARRPQVRRYGIDPRGIIIGDKLYAYHGLKSFAVIGEGAIKSIVLTPLKRFTPPISMFFPPDQEEQIVAALSRYLPLERREHDMVEKLMQRIKF